MKRPFSLALIVMCFTMSAFADIAQPKAKPVEAPMEIHLDADAKDARLVIPRSALSQLRAQLDGLDDSANTASVTATGVTRAQTIASGAFLSLALIFGGVWFVRGGRSATRGGKAIVIGAVFAGAAFATSLTWANAGPPSEARTISGKMFSSAVHMYRVGFGSVKIELGDSNRVELIVPDPPDKPKTGE